MTDLTDWHATNDRYLSEALAWLRGRLTARAGTQTSDADDSGSQMTRAAALTDGPVPALVLLGRRFGLSAFEQDVLLMCAGMELDPGLANLCAQAQHDPERPFPTFGLALMLFDEPAWDVVSPERP